MTNMKSIKQLTFIALAGVLLYACGTSEATDRIAELDQLRADYSSLGEQIRDLEAELIASGELTKSVQKTLVTTFKVEPGPFFHKVEVRGAVESKKNIQLTPEMPGRVISIKTKEGRKIKKGDLLVQLDAEIIRSSIAEVKTQLDLATTIFEKQERLWKDNIGTEIQFLQAKNNKESLERKMSTLNTQMRQSRIYAPFDGVVDAIPVKEGEMAQPGMPVIRLVNPASMYLSADVSEAFLGKFKAGDPVDVYFPSQDKGLMSTVSSVGEVINSQNRTFRLDILMPVVDFPVKPNQVVVLNLKDYEVESALVIPKNLIQVDSRGSYVYGIFQEGDNMVSKKIHMDPGVSFNLRTEVKAGIKPGQVLADKGYRELTQNTIVEIAED